MLQIIHNISVSSEHIDSIVDIIKAQKIDNPVFITANANFHSISFESDYEEYEMVKHIESAFPEYECLEEIPLGESDVKIVINRIQTSNSTDGWGRQLNEDSIDKKLYFIKKNIVEPKQYPPNDAIRVLLGQNEEKNILLEILNGVNRTTDEKGYLVVDPTGKAKSKYLSDKLFTKRSDAFWAGYNEITEYIKDLYIKFQKAQKAKRKHKQTFDEWTDHYEEVKRKENEGVLSEMELNDLKPGDKVSHSKFGFGTVVSNDKKNCLIDFETGAKLLNLKFVLLKRVNNNL